MTDHSRLKRIVDLLDTTTSPSPFARIVRMFVAFLGFLAVVATLVGVGYQISDRSRYAEDASVNQAEREEALLDAERRRTDTAFDLLFRPVTGDVGKGEAFNVSVAAGRIGIGVNLSCRAMSPSGKCDSPAVFSAINASGHLDDENADYEGIKFSGNIIIDSQLRAQWTAIDLDDATIIRSDLSRALMVGSFKNTRFVNSDLSAANLQGEFFKSEFSASNISGSNFLILAKNRLRKQYESCFHGEQALVFNYQGQSEPEYICISQDFLPNMNGAWFWADVPPAFDPDLLELENADEIFRICAPLPQFQQDNLDYECSELSLSEAKIKYEKEWSTRNQERRCNSRNNPEITSTRRTLPPQPCEMDE